MERGNLINQLMDEIQTMSKQVLLTMIMHSSSILENAKIQKARTRKAMKERELQDKPYCIVCCQIASQCKCEIMVSVATAVLSCGKIVVVGVVISILNINCARLVATTS